MARLTGSKRFLVALATLLTLFGIVVSLAFWVTAGFEPASVPVSSDGGTRGPGLSFDPESEQLANRVKGSVGVSAPARAQEGDSFTIVLRVASENLADVLQSLQEKFPENENVLGQSNVKLTSRMAAEVWGQGFDISPEGDQFQVVSATEPTTWIWEAKAVEPGHRRLTFQLSSTHVIAGKETPKHSYFFQNVEITVRPKTASFFIEEHWKWLATTLVIPALGALWALFRKPKDAAGRPQPSAIARVRERHRQRRL